MLVAAAVGGYRETLLDRMLSSPGSEESSRSLRRERERERRREVLLE